jgi:hypothetical protein
MAYISDVTGQIPNQNLKTDYTNVPQVQQVHYHIEETQNWTKASVIIAGIGTIISLIYLFRGK